jgi:GTPase SAR1 family protein
MTKDKLSLDIKPIQPKNAYQHPPVPHKVLPQHEFSLVLVAPKGSGKTNLICNLLLNHYKGYFHDIWVCSPTVDNDPKWEVVKAEKKVLAENRALKRILGDGLTKGGGNKRLPKVVHNTEDALVKERQEQRKSKFEGKIREEQFFGDMRDLFPRLDKQDAMIHHLKNELGYEEKAKFIADRILIILDDQAGLYQGGSYGNPMVNFMLKHRHYNSSVIVVTQAYKAIPKSIRTNCNALVVFEVPNMAELKVVYEEWPTNMSEEVWMQVYQYAIAEPFAFLYINTHFKKGERVYKNFTHRLQPTSIEAEAVPPPVAESDAESQSCSDKEE